MATSTSRMATAKVEKGGVVGIIEMPRKLLSKSEDFNCPVCLGILIEPVTMPCSHALCYRCFRQNVNQTSLLCPVCRSRISSWTRRATRQNCLVNQQLWTLIQKMFPDKVRRKLKSQVRGDADHDAIISDSESDSDDSAESGPVQRPSMSKPGEIRKEYEEFLTKNKEEEERVRKLQQRQSEELVAALKDQERVEEEKRLQLIQKDFLVAKLLSQAINKTSDDKISRPNKRRPASSNGLKHNDDHRTPAEAFERSQSCIHLSLINDPIEVEAENSQSNKFVSYTRVQQLEPSGSLSFSESSSSSKVTMARSTSMESEDSITEELRHFRPIKVAPKTPPRLLANGRTAAEPQLIHATPRNLMLQLDSNSSGNSASKDAAPTIENAAWLQKRLALIESDRRNSKVTTLSKSTETRKPIPWIATAAIRQQPSASQINTATTFVAPRGSRVLRCEKSNSNAIVAKRKCTNVGDGNDDHNNNSTEKSGKRAHCDRATENDGDLGQPDYRHIVGSHFLDTDFVENDRLIAEQLHRALQQELLKDHYAIDRRKGTPGEYNLRSKRTGILS